MRFEIQLDNTKIQSHLFFQKVHGVVEQPIEPRETRATGYYETGEPKNNIFKTIVNDDGDEVIDWDQHPTIVKFEDIGAWLAYKESRE